MPPPHLTHLRRTRAHLPPERTLRTWARTLRTLRTLRTWHTRDLRSGEAGR